jgi:hypothetical protein
MSTLNLVLKVYRNIIHHGRKMELIQMSIMGQVAKTVHHSKQRMSLVHRWMNLEGILQSGRC